MILIRRINITILLEGEAEGKSSNHFRKSFMDMLKRAICYLWLTLLTVILNTWKPTQRARRLQIIESNLILQMKADMKKQYDCLPGLTSIGASSLGSGLISLWNDNCH